MPFKNIQPNWKNCKPKTGLCSWVSLQWVMRGSRQEMCTTASHGPVHITEQQLSISVSPFEPLKLSCITCPVLDSAAETFMNYAQMKPRSVMVWTGMTERPVSSLLQSLLAGGARSALISPCTVLMLWLRSPPWLYLTCFTPPTGSQRTLCLSCSDRWRLHMI